MNTTIGVFENRRDAEGAISELRGLGLTDGDISYLYSTPEVVEVTKTEHRSGMGGGAASGAATGAVLGAIAGIVVAAGVLPGIGALFVAGPLAAALGLTGAAATTAAGAMTGLAAGGIIGALANLGVSREDARMYEERVKHGGILVSATSSLEGAVKDVFKKYGASDIHEYARA